ncbi:ProQ/FINO family protein [Tabrizicola sp.]|uniref:ProQ/FINO family protein n=1 Tax=Tabrizicola sp. TaxID=2005166 RepID=UPI003D2E7791
MTNPLQLRQFDPEFLANFQKGLVELLGLDGTDNLPPIFKLPVAVALTDNAADQLCQRYGIAADDERAKHVTAALERYKRRVQYHYAMLKGEAKYDLDMQKAGEITDREREDWQRRFEHLKRQQKIGNRKAQMTAIQRQFSRV